MATFLTIILASLSQALGAQCVDLSGDYEGALADGQIPVSLELRQSGCNQLVLSWITNGSRDVETYSNEEKCFYETGENVCQKTEFFTDSIVFVDKRWSEKGVLNYEERNKYHLRNGALEEKLYLMSRWRNFPIQRTVKFPLKSN